MMPVEWEGACYGYDDTEVEFDEARSRCQSAGGDLAWVMSRAENDFIYQTLTLRAKAYWLGARDTSGNRPIVSGNFRWLRTNSRLTAGFMAWYPGEPNDNDYELCLEKYDMSDNDNGLWNNGECDRLFGYVCKKEVGGFTPIRLRNGQSFHETFYTGYVELNYDRSQWRPVCDREWGQADANVVCRMLGISGSGAKATSGNRWSYSGSQFPNSFWLDRVECSGGEEDIAQCKHRGWGVYDSSCTSSRLAGVECHCAFGYFGWDCLSACPENCENECQRITGECFSCKHGFYGNECSKSCHPTCKKCNRANGWCEICRDSYYLAPPRTSISCLPCPPGCADRACNHRSGTCFGCRMGFYGLKCESTCPANCLEPGVCHQNDGDCMCRAGFYGTKCNKTCNENCAGSQCEKDSGRCKGCIPGFYGGLCNLTCPATCVASGICHQRTGDCPCSENYYGFKCGLQCPENCANDRCDKESGHCYGCEGGYHGLFCNQSCSAGCDTPGWCKQIDGSCECKQGYYGSECTSRCSSNCVDSLCDRRTGQCQSCFDGFHGEYCNETCPLNCHHRFCNQSDGDCLCNNGFFGKQCTKTCPLNCGGNYCNKVTGECLACITGFHGAICNQTCPVECGHPGNCQMLTGACCNGRPC